MIFYLVIQMIFFNHDSILCDDINDYSLLIYQWRNISLFSNKCDVILPYSIAGSVSSASSLTKDIDFYILTN